MAPTFSGHFHSTKGAIKQTFGRTVGWRALEMRGASERTAGNAEIHAARGRGWANATGTRMTGKTDQIAGAVTGNGSQRMRGNFRRSRGDAMQGLQRNL